MQELQNSCSPTRPKKETSHGHSPEPKGPQQDDNPFRNFSEENGPGSGSYKLRAVNAWNEWVADDMPMKYGYPRLQPILSKEGESDEELGTEIGAEAD